MNQVGVQQFLVKTTVKTRVWAKVQSRGLIKLLSRIFRIFLQSPSLILKAKKEWGKKGRIGVGGE